MIGLIKDRMGDGVEFYVHEQSISVFMLERHPKLLHNPSPLFGNLKKPKSFYPDCDFMGTEEDSGLYTCDFTKNRKLANVMIQ